MNAGVSRQTDRPPRATSDEVVDVTASSLTDCGSVSHTNIKEKSAARGSRDVVPHDEWIIRGQSAFGPVSWVWGSNDNRNHRTYRCNNGRCNSLLQLQLSLSRQNLGIVHEPLASTAPREISCAILRAPITAIPSLAVLAPILHTQGPGPGSGLVSTLDEPSPTSTLGPEEGIPKHLPMPSPTPGRHFI